MAFLYGVVSVLIVESIVLMVAKVLTKKGRKNLWQ